MQLLLACVVACAMTMMSVSGNICDGRDCGDDGCVINECCLAGAACCADRNINEGMSCKPPKSPLPCRNYVCGGGRCVERVVRSGTPCTLPARTEACENDPACDANGICVARFKPSGENCIDGECVGRCTGTSAKCNCATATTSTTFTTAAATTSTPHLQTQTLSTSGMQTPTTATASTTTTANSMPKDTSPLSTTSSTATAGLVDGTPTASVTDSAPSGSDDTMDERALLPWLVPLLIALGVVFVVALLVAIFAALRTKRRQTQEEASAAPQRGVSLGTYAPVPAAPGDYSSSRLDPEFQSARDRDDGAEADGRVYDMGKLSGGF
jgi:hypothetical protein